MSPNVLLAVAVVLSVPAAFAQPATVTVAAEADGRAIYNFRCYFCHGYSGNAKTVAASFMKPPPADFTRALPTELTEARIEATLLLGKPGTAMKSFAKVLDQKEIRAVARFVHDEFVVKKAANTRYHTAENGWPNHERYEIAFPFATGEIALDHPWEKLSPTQVQGKQLFLATCISCHDRGPTKGEAALWETRPLSYPRNNFSYTAPPKPDALASASPYALHDQAPKLKNLTKIERKGERLFQSNCAFCHAADGTGKNWIGSFLEPHPRNLRDSGFMSSLTRERFIAAVNDGLPNTSMPAWKSVFSRSEIDAIADYVARAFHHFAKPSLPANESRH